MQPFPAPAGVSWSYRHTVLGVVLAGNFAQFGSRVILSPVVPDLIETFSTTKGAIGLSLTLLWGAYAVVQFPSGVLADRYGERVILVTAMALATIGGVLLALSPSFLAFTVFALFLGAGTGLFLTVGITLVTKLYRNTGQALGLVTVGSGTAGLVGPPVAAFVGVRFGWRSVPLLGAVAALLVLVFLLARVRPTAPDRPDRPLGALFSVESLVAILGRPAVAYTLVLAVIANFVFQGLLSFFPVFLVEHWSVTIETASLAFGALFVGYTVGQPLMGNLSDRYGRDAILGVESLAMLAGLVAVIWGSHPITLAAGIGCISIGLTWFAVVNARITDVFDPEERGTGLGLVRTVTLLLGALGSVVVGVIADAAGWTAAFGFLIGLLVVALLTLGTNWRLDLSL